MLRMLLVLIVFTTSAVQEQQQELRTWNDKTGSYSVSASLVIKIGDRPDDAVTLEKEDGSKVTVPFEKLSVADQRFVQRQRKDAQRARERAARAQMNEENAESSTSSELSSTAEKIWNWRGPNQDGISDETGLLQEWPQSGPTLLWSVQGLGNAMSSVAVSSDKIFTLGQRDGAEYLIALNRDDGQKLWATRVGNGGESNSTPTIAGDHVYAIGLAGDLICAEISSGNKVWSKSFANDFGGKMMSQWGYSESPLVDGDRLICTPGGPSAMVVALNRFTGKTIWKTPMTPGGSRGTDGAGYSTVVISKGAGIKQYITLVGRGLISVAADDGTPLWQYEKIANTTANVPTPIVDGDYVFCSSGYDDGGTALLKLSRNRKQVNYEEVYYFSANQLQNHHGGMIKIGDYVFMGEGHNKGFPMCVEFRTGRKVWPKQRGAGSGSAAIVAADNQLYFRYEDGQMALIDAAPDEYRLRGTFEIATRDKQSWAHPVIFDGKLYLRDQVHLHCYDISR